MCRLNSIGYVVVIKQLNSYKLCLCAAQKNKKKNEKFKIALTSITD